MRATTGLGRIFAPPPERDVGDELAQAYTDDQQQHGHVVQARRSFLEWALDVPEPKRPLDLTRFAFQRELYSAEAELAKLLVVKKAAQIGVSANLIRWSLRRADLGNTVLYIMPRLLQATEFSDLRVKPLLRASAYLRARQRANEDATDTKRLKTIGAGALAIRGSKSEEELISVDADALALDEYDRLVVANLPRVMQRVTGPMSQGLVREVSTPTIPNFGIAKAFALTDQRRWHVRCGGKRSSKGAAAAGGHWNRLAGIETFHELLDHDDAVLRCGECRRALDVREGEWVAAYPDGDRPIGYHAPKFVVHGVNLRGIVERSKLTSERARKSFHNEDLGEEWQSATAGLTDEQIAAAVRPYPLERNGYAGHNLVTMGVDVAASRALNVRISEHLDEHTKRALWIGEVDNGIAPWGAMPGHSAFEILGAILVRYRVRVAVVDHMPDPRLVKAWCERWRGRAYRVSYADNQRVVLARQDAKKDPTKLTARPLESIDATVDLIRRMANLLPEDRPEDYDAHLKARVLETMEDPDDGSVKQVWLKTGPDDYLQAETFDVIATHMAYVEAQAGQIAEESGTVVPARPDVVAEEQEWQDGPSDDLDYSEGPADDPLSGW